MVRIPVQQSLVSVQIFPRQSYGQQFDLTSSLQSGLSCTKQLVIHSFPAMTNTISDKHKMSTVEFLSVSTPSTMEFQKITQITDGEMQSHSTTAAQEYVR